MSLTAEDLQNISTLFDKQFARIDDRFAGLEQRLERFRTETAEEFRAIDRRFTEHDAKFEAIHAKLAEHDAEFRSIHAKLTTHDAQFAKISTELTAIRSELRFVRDVCGTNTQAIDTLHRDFQIFSQSVNRRLSEHDTLFATRQ